MDQRPITPRIAPLEEPFEPRAAEVLGRWMPRNAPLPPLALFRLLAREPNLAQALEPAGKFNLKHAPGTSSELDPRDRELVIQRVCARCNCEYEWGVHVTVYAARVGIEDAQVAATRRGGSADPAFSARDRLLIALADALHDDAAIDDELWAKLRSEFSETQLLHLLALAGWYHTVSYLANASRIPLEPWAARFPDSAAREQP